MESALKKYRGQRPLKEVADHLGISPSVCHKWENNRVPAEKCKDVSEKTGIPLHKLRPDVFPVPAEGQAA